ncbi:hypothetical protein ACRV5B_002751 [Citrobacter freundii]|nr:hypothetical protein [Citrobacter freundii]
MPELLCDLKWSPDGCVVETITAGVYSDGELPARAEEIATELGIIKFGGGDVHVAAESDPEPAVTKRGKTK